MSQDLRALVKAKREEILAIAARRHARNVRLFGSVARGEAGPESDIDFVVELTEGATLLTHSALERELAALLGRKVEVVSDRGLRPHIRERVFAEAVPV